MNFDHVGLAVQDTGEALEFYRDVLGLEVVHTEEFGGMRVTFLGESGEFELLEPLEDGAVMDYLERRGEGVQHVAVRVDDLNGEVERLEGDVRFVVEPERGAWGKRVAFVHPRDACGVLLEFCEY